MLYLRKREKFTGRGAGCCLSSITGKLNFPWPLGIVQYWILKYIVGKSFLLRALTLILTLTLGLLPEEWLLQPLLTSSCYMKDECVFLFLFHLQNSLERRLSRWRTGRVFFFRIVTQLRDMHRSNTCNCLCAIVFLSMEKKAAYGQMRRRDKS